MCGFQNRRLACYTLKCLVIIYLAALRPHFRVFLNPPTPSRQFFLSGIRDYLLFLLFFFFFVNLLIQHVHVFVEGGAEVEVFV